MSTRTTHKSQEEEAGQMPRKPSKPHLPLLSPAPSVLAVAATAGKSKGSAGFGIWSPAPGKHGPGGPGNASGGKSRKTSGVAAMSVNDNEPGSSWSKSAEPKVFKKGDQVITSYVDEETGRIAVYEVGVRLEVGDFADDRLWYPAKIVEVDSKEKEILVHFENWSSRFDEWIKMDSNRLRPSPNTNVVKTQFQIGERVEALWSTGGQRYACTIQSILPGDYYQVLFDDGIKLKKKYNQIFKLKKVGRGRPFGSLAAGKSKGLRPPPLLIPAPILKTEKDIKVQDRPRRRSSRSMSKQSTITSPPDLLKGVPSPATSVELGNEPEIESKLDDDIETSGSTTPTADEPNKNEQTPLVHYSIFTPITADLGKRKRTIHDYSMLLKTRLPKLFFEDGSPKSTPVSSPIQTRTRRRRAAAAMTDSMHLQESDPVVTLNLENDNTDNETDSLKESEELIEFVDIKETDDPLLEQRGKGELVEFPDDLENTTANLRANIGEAANSPSHDDPNAPLPKRRRTVHNYSTLLNPKFDELVVSPRLRPNRHSRSRTSSDDAISNESTIKQNRRKVDTLVDVDSETIPEELVPDEVTDDFEDLLKKAEIEGRKFELDKKNVELEMEGNKTKSMLDFEQPYERLIENRSMLSRNRKSRRFRLDNVTKFHDNEISLGEINCSEVETTKSIVVGKKSLELRIKALELEEKNDKSELMPTRRRSRMSMSLKKSDIQKICPTSNSTEKLTKITIGGTPKSPPRDLTTTTRRKPRSGTDLSSVFQIWETAVLPTNPPSKRKSSYRPLEVKPKFPESHGKSIKIEKYSFPPKLLPAVQIESKSDSEEDLLDPDDYQPSSPSSLTSKTFTPAPVKECAPPAPQPKYAKVTKHYSPLASSPLGIMRPSPHSSSRRKRPTASRKWRMRKAALLKAKSYELGVGGPPIREKMLRVRKSGDILNGMSAGRLAKIRRKLAENGIEKRMEGVTVFKDVCVDIINCSCGLTDEHGLMVQCELCQCWQHGNCFGFEDVDKMPPYYVCHPCRHPDLQKDLRRADWNHEFNKTGNFPKFSFCESVDPMTLKVVQDGNDLLDRLYSVRELIHSTHVKINICGAVPDHPKIYQWHKPHPTPEEETQVRTFNKIYRPVLKRLLRTHIKDLGNYKVKFGAKVENHIKMREEKKFNCGRPGTQLLRLDDDDKAKLISTRNEDNSALDESTIISSVISDILDKLDSTSKVADHNPVETSASTPEGKSKSTDFITLNKEATLEGKSDGLENLMDIDLDLSESDRRFTAMEEGLDAALGLNPNRLLDAIEDLSKVTDDPETDDLLLNIFDDPDFSDSLFQQPIKINVSEDKRNSGPTPPVRITPELCRVNLEKSIRDQQRLIDDHLDEMENKVLELELAHLKGRRTQQSQNDRYKLGKLKKTVKFLLEQIKVTVTEVSNTEDAAAPHSPN